MTTAATSAPTSGRARTRENIDRWGRWGAGAAGGAGGWVTTEELMERSRGGREVCRWRGSRHGPAPPGGLPGVVLGVRDDLVDVGLVDDGRTGQHRPPTAD